jgi:hypothetical protein
LTAVPPPTASLRIPWWVTVLDVLCLVLAALLVRSVLGEGFRLAIGSVVLVSFRSWSRVAVWLAAALVIRHLAWRRVPWHSRVVDWLRRVTARDAVRAAWMPFILSRVLVLAAGYVAVSSIGFAEARSRAVPNDFLDLHVRFDAGWYFRIASVGYDDGHDFNPAVQNTIAFFPGLPLLIRAVAGAIDVDLWTAGVLIVIVSFFFGLVYLYRLARLDLSDDEARASLLLLAFYPFAMCYSAVLTESVFLLAVTAAFFYFRRAAYLKAVPFAFALGLLRPNGFLIAVPLTIVAVVPFARSRGWLPGSADAEAARWTRLIAAIAVAALPLIAMLGHAAYVQSMTGDAFAFVKAQQAWGRGKAELLNVLDARSSMIASEGLAAYARSYPIEILESGAAIVALAAVVPIVLRFGLAYGLFVAMAVLPPFITLGSISLGRYTAPLFPLFLLLGASIPPARRVYWLVAFASLQALLSTLFFTSRPPY